MSRGRRVGRSGDGGRKEAGMGVGVELEMEVGVGKE